MSRWKRPLSAGEVRKILKNLGFTHRNTAGSHEQWVKTTGRFRKVTLDPPKSPFSHTLIKFMADQAGVSVKEFYEAMEL